MKITVRKIKTDSGIWASFLLCSQYLFHFLYKAVPTSYMNYMLYVLMGLSIIAYFFVFKKCIERKTFNSLLFPIMIFSLFLCNYLLIGNISMKQIVWSLLVFTSMALLMSYYHLHFSVVKWIFWGYVFYVALRILQGVDTENILSSSTNYIAYFAMLYSLPLYIAREEENKKVSFLPAVICLLLSVKAVGRGGIIMAFVLCGVLLLSNGIEIKKTKRHVLNMIVCIVALIGGAVIITYRGYLMTAFSRFIKRGLDTPRYGGWKEYFELISQPRYFLFGAPLKETEIIMPRMGGSLHNSYLQMHACGGILYFILIFTCMILLVYFFMKKRKMWELALLMAFMVKSLVDADIPTNSGGEILIYYFILTYIHISRSGMRIYERKKILRR